MLSKLISLVAMGAPMHSVHDGELFQHWLLVVLSSVLGLNSAVFMIDGRLVWILMSLEL